MIHRKPAWAVAVRCFAYATALASCGVTFTRPDCLRGSLCILAGVPALQGGGDGGAGQAGSADGTSAAARFNGPNGVAVDEGGIAYVADTGNHTIRKVTQAGVVTTLAGSAGQPGNADGTGAAARFNVPAGVAVDASGNVYVADADNHNIRKVTPAGVVTTLADCAGLRHESNANPPGNSAGPFGVAVDVVGNVYFVDDYDYADQEYSVHATYIGKVTPAGSVTTMTVTDAGFNGPRGAAVDASGNLYIADTGNHTIRRVTPGGVVTTLAGSAGQPGSGDGTGSAARFSMPSGVALDASGNVYVADTGNGTIRNITPRGIVSTRVGTPGQSSPGTVPGVLPASLLWPVGVAVSPPSGTGYIVLSDAVLVW